MAKKPVCRRNFAELLAAGVGGGESISAHTPSSPSRGKSLQHVLSDTNFAGLCFMFNYRVLTEPTAIKKSTKNTKRCELVASFFLFGKPCRRRHRVGSRCPLFVGELEQCSLNLSGILKAQTPASILRHEKLPKLPELAAPDRRWGQ